MLKIKSQLKSRYSTLEKISRDFDLDSVNYKSAGITTDGTHFYVVNTDDRFDVTQSKVYVYTMSGTHVPTKDFDVAILHLNGITTDGTYLYIVSHNRDRVYVYTKSGTQVRWFKLNSANNIALGLTTDGTYLYVTQNNPSKVYVYTMSGTYVPTKGFDLASTHIGPNGITTDGTHFYVVSYTDNKVFVYTTSGTHVPTKDFDLDPDNTEPYGITTDGTHLYVTDWLVDKVFVYNLDGTPPSSSFSLHLRHSILQQIDPTIAKPNFQTLALPSDPRITSKYLPPGNRWLLRVRKAGRPQVTLQLPTFQMIPGKKCKRAYILCGI